MFDPILIADSMHEKVDMWKEYFRTEIAIVTQKPIDEKQTTYAEIFNELKHAKNPELNKKAFINFHIMGAMMNMGTFREDQKTLLNSDYYLSGGYFNAKKIGQKLLKKGSAKDFAEKEGKIELFDEDQKFGVIYHNPGFRLIELFYESKNAIETRLPDIFVALPVNENEFGVLTVKARHMLASNATLLKEMKALANNG